MLEEIKAEIERLKKEHQEPTFRGDEYEEGGVNGYQLALDKVLAKLDTLKEQPVELKEEIDKYISERWKLNGINPTTPVYLYDFAISDLKECARHFYNLGRGSSEKPNDLVSELKHHLATTPKEQLQKEWDELKKWDNIGPTVQEFLHGKQEKSEIPTNLDEAANEYAETHFRREYFQVPKDGMRRAFKAGWCAHDAQISKRSDNLDEAAENLDGFNDEQDKAASIYTDSLLEKLKIDGSIITPLSVYDAFKAGAMWDREQGVSFNTEVGWIDGPTIMDWPDDILDGFKMGDKVIVQIRKKDE